MIAWYRMTTKKKMMHKMLEGWLMFTDIHHLLKFICQLVFNLQAHSIQFTYTVLVTTDSTIQRLRFSTNG